MTDLFIVSALSKGNIVTIQNLDNGRYLKRHPNDLKIFTGNRSQVSNKHSIELGDHADLWRQAFSDIDKYNYDNISDSPCIDNGDSTTSEIAEDIVEAVPEEPILRQSTRRITPNRNIYNDDFIT